MFFVERNRQNISSKSMYICKYHFKISNCLVRNFQYVTNTFPRFFLIKPEFKLCYALRKTEFSLKFDTCVVWPTCVKRAVCLQVIKVKKWQGFSKENRRAGGQPHPAKAMSAGCGLCHASLKPPETPFGSVINQCCFHLAIRAFFGVTRCKYKSDIALSGLF